MSVSDETPTLDKSSSESSTTPKGKKRIDVAVAFVLCGALFSLLIFLYMFKQERDTTIQGFHVQIAQDTARFEQRLAYSFYNVASLQAYLDLSPQMAGMDLSAVASRIVNPHQGVEALLWLPEGQLN
ncbi:MAG: hypothetical protein ACJARJ_002453, partial [Neptuniibacter pectenicola]